MSGHCEGHMEKGADLRCLWMLKRVLELSHAIIEPFLAHGRPEDRLTLAPHRQVPSGP